MRYEEVYADGRLVEDTTPNVPRYNFYWQMLYKLKKPIAIPKQTRIVVTAHFDNSLRNKYNPDAGQAVRFGDSTNDEMLAVLIMLLKNPRKNALSLRLIRQFMTLTWEIIWWDRGPRHCSRGR